MVRTLKKDVKLDSETDVKDLTEIYDTSKAPVPTNAVARTPDMEGHVLGTKVDEQKIGSVGTLDTNETTVNANFETEAVTKIVDLDSDGSKLMTIQDVVDALRIIVSQGSSLSMPVQSDMLNIIHLVLDRPVDIMKIEKTELSFVEDVNQEWCIMQGRIRDYEHGAPTNYEE